MPIGRRHCPFHCQLLGDDPGFALLQKAMKSASRRVWCSHLYPSPLRMLRYLSGAQCRSVIARHAAPMKARQAPCLQRREIDAML
ncbi:hypothetical protein GGD62_008279 [Bradyrhizobium sp. ERR14]|nr:hypothetical protein [Bradyrhizobium sp. ERR14]